MKNISLLLLVLVLGAGIISGCGEKKAEKAKEAVIEAAEGVKEEAAEEKAIETQEAAPETAPVVKEAAPAAIGAVKEKAEEVKKAATAVVKEEAKAAAAAPAKMIPGGDVIFKAKCLACHGPGGVGTAMAPAFKGNSWVKGASRADIAGVIKNGREGSAKRYKEFVLGMPAQKGMPENDVGALVDYIKSIN